MKVPVVANAASYFRTFDDDESSEKKVVDDAFERYEVKVFRDQTSVALNYFQRNNKLLLELFERPVDESDNSIKYYNRGAHVEQLRELIMAKDTSLSDSYEQLLQEEHPSLNMKELHKIDNIKTVDEFWQVKDELEKQYNVNFIHSPSKVKLVSVGISNNSSSTDTITILQLR